MKKYVLSATAIIYLLVIQSCWAGGELNIVYTYGQKKNEVGEILQEFGKKSGITVNAKYEVQDHLKSTIMAMLELQQAPDAVIIPSDHLGLHDFVKYSEINPRLFKANIPKRIWDAASSDGKIFGAPIIQGNHLVLYYNKSLVKEPAKNWQAMFAQKNELDAKKINTIAWSYHEPFYFLPILGAFGGWPLDNGKITLNTPEMIAALDFYKSLQVQSLPYPQCGYRCSVDLFKLEKVAYTINGQWEANSFYDALGEKLGVSAIPSIMEKNTISSFSTHVIAFPNNSLKGKKRAELIKLVNYLQSPNVQQLIWNKAGGIPVEASAFDTAQKKSTGYMKDILGLMSDTKPLPADEAMTFIWDAMSKGLLRNKEGILDANNTAIYMQQLAEHHLHNAKLQTPAPSP